MYETLRSAHPHMTVYKKEDIPERYHLKNHHRVGSLFLVADEGYAIVWVSNFRKSRIHGMYEHREYCIL